MLAFHSRRPTVYATRGMVAASQPLAALAALDTLKAGGNAADAAVTAAAMLAVLEPMMTGLGGDCFALYYEAGSGAVTALNGSGRAPAAASIEAITATGARQMPEYGGCTVSVPGTVAAWQDLLARHGTRPLAAALAPAIEAAERGYPVTEIVAMLWQGAEPHLRRPPVWTGTGLADGPGQAAATELLPGGRAPRTGEIVRLPTLAATLREVAAGGADAFYRGSFADRASALAQEYGGWLAPGDFAAHRSDWDTPIHTDYRDVRIYECPPNGQGLAALLALGLARGYDLAAMSTADRAHTLIECMRLAIADAQHWVADPRHVALPLAALLDARYADERRRRIAPDRAARDVPWGDPRHASDTVYLAVVDGAGNACSLINSVFRSFGTGLVVPGTGVCLQNRASLFSLDPAHPNALAPGKRPYQTIIPALSVHAQGPHAGRLHACFGVMGGQMQPQGHLQVLVNLLDLGLAPQPALDALRWQLTAIAPGLGMQPPGAAAPGGRVLVERGFEPAVITALERRGHHLTVLDDYDRVSMGGAQLIVRDPATGVLAGASEPRMDGLAVGW